MHLPFAFCWEQDALDLVLYIHDRNSQVLDSVSKFPFPMKDMSMIFECPLLMEEFWVLPLLPYNTKVMHLHRFVFRSPSAWCLSSIDRPYIKNKEIIRNRSQHRSSQSVMANQIFRKCGVRFVIIVKVN